MKRPGLFQLVANDFGYPIYVAVDVKGNVSDVQAEATIYDDRDNPATKIKFFNALTGLHFEAVNVQA